MFTQKDIEQIQSKGLTVEKVEQQIENFKKGFPFMNIIKAATVGDGIIRLDEKSMDEYIKLYENALNELDVVKFVPASGAASRMFKALFAFMNSGKSQRIKEKGDFHSNGFEHIYHFFKEIDKFAFYEDLDNEISKTGNSLSDELKHKEYVKILKAFLTEVGLNYGNLPKGLLKFHKYDEKSRTPAEEHLVEGATYSNSNGKVRLHFTVSPEHRSGFDALIKQVLGEYEKRFGVKYEISFSEQKTSTDTIAVTPDNEPFREDDGTLLFRPGGHGALIENLNDIDSDIIFIKNIDNVAPESLSEPTYMYKKAIAGVLYYYREKINDYLLQLKSETGPSIALMDEIGEFLQKELCVLPSDDFKPKTQKEQIDYLESKLNRPLRVCGMVKNEGEPGGGPFWTTNQDGTVSLQIVEGSQIDPNSNEAQEIVKSATHFNPVDLVCFVKNVRKKKFNLRRYIDHNTGFISSKSKGGRDLKALELPGLWNGAMADWNTIFVEVPIETFNPVKTVNDLLRPQHQA